jgi:hypothetical protein
MREVCDEWRVSISDWLLRDLSHVIAWILGVQAWRSWHKLNSLFHSTTEVEEKKMRMEKIKKYSELPYPWLLLDHKLRGIFYRRLGEFTMTFNAFRFSRCYHLSAWFPHLSYIWPSFSLSFIYLLLWKGPTADGLFEDRSSRLSTSTLRPLFLLQPPIALLLMRFVVILAISQV